MKTTLSRLGPQLISQLATSLANFALTAATLRLLDVEDLGKFAELFAVLTITTVVARGVTTYPLLLGLKADYTAARTALMMAAVIGLGGTLVAVPLCFALDMPSEFYVIAFAIPVAVVEDTHRYLAFARRKSGIAATCDSLWLAVQVVVSIPALAIGSAGILFAAWAVGGLGGLLCGELMNGTRFHWRIDGAHLLSDKRLRAATTVESSFSVIIYQLSPIVLAATSSFAAAGAMRGAQTLVGPASSVFVAVNPLATQAIVAKHSTRDAFRTALLSVGVLSVVIVGVALGLVTTPHSYVRKVIGSAGIKYVALVPQASFNLLAAIALAIGIVLVHYQKKHLLAMTIRLAFAGANVVVLVVVARTSGVGDAMVATGVLSLGGAATAALAARRPVRAPAGARTEPML